MTTIMIEIEQNDDGIFVDAFRNAIATHWNNKMMCPSFAHFDNGHLVYEFFGRCKRMRTRSNRHGMWQVLMDIANNLFWKANKSCVLHYCDGETYIHEDGHINTHFVKDTIVSTYADFNGLHLDTTDDYCQYISKRDMVG